MWKHREETDVQRRHGSRTYRNRHKYTDSQTEESSPTNRNETVAETRHGSHTYRETDKYTGRQTDTELSHKQKSVRYTKRIR